MAYIYKITNKISGKSYIGKTLSNIKKRFKEHCNDSKKENIKNRPLYMAMNKYGIDNFKIDILEEVDDRIADSKEKKYIELYRTFKHGYNATIGGDGSSYLDYDLIIRTYKKIKNQKEVAKMLNVSVDSVRNILRIRKINMLDGRIACLIATRKAVEMYDLNDNYIRIFLSASDALRFLKPNAKNKKEWGTASHIIKVCSGKRKTSYGYKWKFSK